MWIVLEKRSRWHTTRISIRPITHSNPYIILFLLILLLTIQPEAILIIFFLKLISFKVLKPHITILIISPLQSWQSNNICVLSASLQLLEPLYPRPWVLMPLLIILLNSNTSWGKFMLGKLLHTRALVKMLDFNSWICRD